MKCGRLYDIEKGDNETGTIVEIRERLIDRVSCTSDLGTTYLLTCSEAPGKSWSR